MSTFETNMDSTKAYTEQHPCSCLSASQNIKQEIVQFAKRAEDLANQLLPSKTTYEGPVIIHDHYYHSWSSPWYWHRPTTVIVTDSKGCYSSPKSEERKKKEKDDTAIALAVIAVTVAAATLYSMGSSFTAWCDAKQEMNNTKAFQDKLDDFSTQFPARETAAVSQAHDAAALKERICRRIKNSEVTSLFIKSGLFLGSVAYAGGVYVAGGYDANSTAQTMGIPLAVSGVALLILKCGLNTAGSRNIRDAKVLKESAQQLQTI